MFQTTNQLWFFLVFCFKDHTNTLAAIGVVAIEVEVVRRTRGQLVADVRLPALQAQGPHHAPRFAVWWKRT